MHTCIPPVLYFVIIKCIRSNRNNLSELLKLYLASYQKHMTYKDKIYVKANLNKIKLRFMGKVGIWRTDRTVRRCQFHYKQRVYRYEYEITCWMSIFDSYLIHHEVYWRWPLLRRWLSSLDRGLDCPIRFWQSSSQVKDGHCLMGRPKARHKRSCRHIQFC